MRAGVKWTPALDAQLRALRGAGRTWDGIAAAMDLGRNTVIERARKKGWARKGKRLAAIMAQSEPIKISERHERAPVQPWHDPDKSLPGGHPTSWAILNEGLPSLAGAKFR